MPRFDLVIFDLDGTLVDSEPLANRVFWEHLNARGVPIGLEQLETEFTGLSLPSCYAVIRERYGLVLGDDFTATLQSATFDAYRARLRPIPGVPEMLAALTLPRCVASSSESYKIRLSLELTKLDHYFGDKLYSARQVARGKPAPDVFLFAAREMGVAPDRCAVVEDSRYGIAAGIAAGMTVFAYDPKGLADISGGAVRLEAMATLLRHLDAG